MRINELNVNNEQTPKKIKNKKKFPTEPLFLRKNHRHKLTYVWHPS